MTRDEYLESVGFWLRDLPWRMRRDLLSEIRAHLDELPARTDLAERLGPPEQYAIDMRSAAGLERRRGVIAFLRARRPRNLVLVAAALAVIGLVIGGVFWVDSYQPVEFGGSFILPPGTKPPSVLSPPGTPPVVGDLVVFHKRRFFELGLEVQNTGRFAIRVLGAPFPRVLPVSARLMVQAPQKGPGPVNLNPLRTFHPFDLEPGERRLLILRGVYSCNATTMTLGGALGAGQTLSLDTFPIRLDFLWRTKIIYLPLIDRLNIVVPKGCPQP